MNKNLYLLLLLICAFVPFTGCSSSDDDPIESDHMDSAEVKYSITISEDMLKYFNITAEYTNSEGQKIGKHIDAPTVEITTTATKFPAKRELAFSVTRTDVPAPTATPSWSTSVAINVSKHFTPSGNIEYALKNENTSYTPKPDKFEDWAKLFIKNMSTGYTVDIAADGTVTF